MFGLQLEDPDKEVCVRINDGQWNDKNCKSEYRFICEGSVENAGKISDILQNLWDSFKYDKFLNFEIRYLLRDSFL